MGKMKYFLLSVLLLSLAAISANLAIAGSSSLDYQSGTEYFGNSAYDDWESVTFDDTFNSGSNVTVFAQIQSERGGNDAYVDMRNIDEAGFEMRIEEDRGSDASWYDGVHNSEYVSWVAFDMDNLPTGVTGGIENFGNEWSSTETVTYDEAFDSDPILFPQIQS